MPFQVIKDAQQAEMREGTWEQKSLQRVWMKQDTLVVVVYLYLVGS